MTEFSDAILGAYEHAVNEDIQEQLRKGWQLFLDVEEREQVVRQSLDEEREPEPDPFLHYEIMLGAILADSFLKISPSARSTILRIVGDPPDFQRLEEAFDEVRSDFDETFTEYTKIRSRSVLDNAAKAGAAVTLTRHAVSEIPRYVSVLDGMVVSAKYWTNNYFHTQVVPALYRDVESLLQSGVPAGQSTYQSFRKSVDDRLLGQSPYWRTVSSGAASRAYHYGVFSAAKQAGYRGYSLQAIIDKKTSEICHSLNGREFWVDEAVLVYERIAEATEDEIKDVHPWLTPESVPEPITHDRHVRETGALVPPFHGHCRTTVRLIFD